MNDQELDAILLKTRHDIVLPGGFQHRVWSRIEAEPSRGGVLQALFDWLARPLGVATGVAAMAALGLLLGALSVPNQGDESLSYIQSISPFIHSGD